VAIAKASGGTRANAHKKSLPYWWDGELISSDGDTRYSDDIEDYYLPNSVRSKLGIIKNIHSYNDIKDYFQKNGVKVTTDLKELEDRADERLKVVEEMGQKLALAHMTYTDIFGKDALKSLKRINLYDSKSETTASFTVNLKGEHDPSVGTIRIRDYNINGQEIFHEFAHVLQDSRSRRGEDLLSFSARANRIANLSPKIRPYFGAIKEHREAERFAEAFGKGFQSGTKEGIDFIRSVYTAFKQHKL